MDGRCRGRGWAGARHRALAGRAAARGGHVAQGATADLAESVADEEAVDVCRCRRRLRSAGDVGATRGEELGSTGVMLQEGACTARQVFGMLLAA